MASSFDAESRALVSQITSLETEKARLLHELDRVDQKLTVTRSEYHALQNRHLPISKLPAEVLSSIFRMIQDFHATFVPFEVIASHVCHHWRRISLGTPLFWSNIDISTGDAEQTNFEGLKQKLFTYLSRSAPCPVTISLRIPYSIILEDYLPLLLPHANRWFRISISFLTSDIDMDGKVILTNFSSVDAPLLQHLSINCSRWHTNRGESPPVKFSTVAPTILTLGAPSLTFARLSGKILGIVQPPLENVQTLHLEGGFKQYMSYDQFATLFNNLPSLINLSLTDFIVRLPQDPLTTPKPIELASLRCLRLCGNSTPAHRLLTLLSLPNIENLVLREIDSFESLVLNPVIRTLTLRECAFSEEEMREVVRAFPMAVNVAFDDSIPQLLDFLGTSTEEDVDEDSDSRAQSYPWPHLATLTLLDMRPRDVDPLCRMVERMKMGGRVVPLVRLTKRARGVLKLKQRLDWLKGMTSVENWDWVIGSGRGEGAWPPGLGYVDEDDF